MTESNKKDQEKDNGIRIKTFTVPLDLKNPKVNIAINTKATNETSKEELIKKAIKFDSQGNTSEAAKCYQSFINRGFKDHRVFSNYGNILKDHGKLEEAELSTRKAIEIKPDYAMAHLNLGSILSSLGKSKEAELSIRKAIEIKSDFAEAYCNLGALLENLGKLKEAEIYIRKAIEIKPNFEQANYNLGLILVNLSKFKEAELTTLKAVKLHPKSARIQLILAIAYYAMGQIDSSLITLEKAHKLDSSDERIKALIAIFKSRRRERIRDIRIEKIKKNLFEDKVNWSPVTLYRKVEEELIQNLYTIKTKKATAKDRYQRPIFGNTRGSNYELFKSEFPIIQNFRQDIIKIISEYFKSEVYITDSFFNIIRPKYDLGGGNKIHAHLSTIDKITELYTYKQKFSLVYYLCVGDQDCEEPGILNFHKPNKSILPKEGMIVIFPASRLHSISYNGQKDRVIISVNFYLI